MHDFDYIMLCQKCMSVECGHVKISMLLNKIHCICDGILKEFVKIRINAKMEHMIFKANI